MKIPREYCSLNMAVEAQSIGSSLSIDQNWVDDAPNLLRSCSTISLSSTRSVANPFHALGAVHRIKRKPARGFGLNHNVRGSGKHGGGSTSVQKVHMMRAVGNVHRVTSGSTSGEWEEKLNKHLEDMRERFKQTRLHFKNVEDSITLRPPFGKFSREPSGASQAEFAPRKDSVSATFKQTIYWSNFLRGVYPNSLSVDELLTKDNVGPYEFIYTRTVQELEARDRDVLQDKGVPDDLVREQQTIGICVDDVATLHNEEENSDDVSNTSDSKDEWGPLSIPDSMNNVFDSDRHSNDMFIDRTHALEDSVQGQELGFDLRSLEISDFQNEFTAILKSDSEDPLNVHENTYSDECLGVVSDSLVDDQHKGNISSNSEINDKFEDALQDLDKSYSQETLGVDEQYHTDSPCPPEDLSDLSGAESSVSLQSFEDQENGGSEVSQSHLGDRSLYESIEEFSHL